jgi:two-component system cell cycle response regulator
VIRPYKSVGRYGGEEFLIIVPGCDANLTTQKAEQIRLPVSTAPIRAAPTDEIVITLSLGATAVCAPDNCQEVLEIADQALYQAKRKARNRVASGHHETRPSAGLDPLRPPCGAISWQRLFL